jgi:hypothetical protein
MRRLSIAFGMMILTFPLISLPAIAQTSPEIGVWKLNLAKSKFYNSQPPKNETRIVEPDGDLGNESANTGLLPWRLAESFLWLLTKSRPGRRAV